MRDVVKDLLVSFFYLELIVYIISCTSYTVWESYQSNKLNITYAWYGFGTLAIHKIWIIISKVAHLVYPIIQYLFILF